MQRRRGQSTAEYAILVGLVIAVAAGVLGVMLKGGMSHKQRQAMDILYGAGNGTLENMSQLITYTQEARQTQVLAGNFTDREVMNKGGAIQKRQIQATTTEAITAEMLNATTP